MLRYDHKSAISNVQTRCIILFVLSPRARVHGVTIKSGWLALRVSVSEEGTFNLIKKFKQVNNSFLQTLRNQVMDYSNAISNLYKSLRSDIISVILNWLYTFRFWTYFLFLFVFFSVVREMIPETCSVVEDESLTEQNLQVFISPRIKLIEMKSGILHWTSPKPFGFQWN